MEEARSVSRLTSMRTHNYTHLQVPHPAVEGEASEAVTLGHTSPRSVSPRCTAHTPSPHPTEGRRRGRVKGGKGGKGKRKSSQVSSISLLLLSADTCNYWRITGRDKSLGAQCVSARMNTPHKHSRSYQLLLPLTQFTEPHI